MLRFPKEFSPRQVETLEALDYKGPRKAIYFKFDYTLSNTSKVLIRLIKLKILLLRITVRVDEEFEPDESWLYFGTMVDNDAFGKFFLNVPGISVNEGNDYTLVVPSDRAKELMVSVDGASTKGRGRGIIEYLDLSRVKEV